MRAPFAALALILLCRTAALALCGDGVVDGVEQCDTGIANGTPGSCCNADCTFTAAGTVCRPAADVCDAEEDCTGSNPACPPDAKSTAVCRSAAGACDLPESCDGVNNGCPADAFAPSTTPCRSAAGVCDIAENCTGSDPACPPDAKSTAVCRSAAGACDLPESCDGVNNGCPADAFAPSTTPCRSAAGACDIAENCTGNDPQCPPDAKSTTVCRSAAGACDVAESCDGVNDDCPADAFVPSTTTCRSAAGECDVAESCTGTGPTCPPDAKSTAVCRSAAGTCDIAEACDGVGNDCPPNGFAPATLVCRSATGQCDAAELCTGTGALCPPDLALPDGTACSDSNACTQTDRCESGVCTGTNPVACTPLDPCHLAGTCNAATGTCSNPAKPDNTPCDDANACTTADSCQGGLCVGLHVAGCCQTDAECDDHLACTEDRCVTGACTHAPFDARCGGGAECRQLMCMPADPAADANGCVARPFDEGGYCTEDNDPCTIDSCRAGDCVHASDQSGPRCPALDAPFRTVLDLLARTRALETALRAAVAGGCTKIGIPTCEMVAGSDADRLVALLASTELDLGTASLALAGRLADSSSPSSPRDPVVRARLALGLVAGTPSELLGFVATLAQARVAHTVDPAFARARRGEARRVLAGTGKFRRQLQRIVARRQTFAR